MSDDNKMGVTEVVGGAAAGAGVAYGVSAYHGKSLTNVTAATLFSEPVAEVLKAGMNFADTMKRFSLDNKIDPKTITTAHNRAMLKIGEKLDIDMGAIMRKMKDFKKTDMDGIEPEKMGEAFADMGKIMGEVIQAVRKKAPTLDAYAKLMKEVQTIGVDTIAETLGKTGAERTKFVEQYMGAFKDFTRSSYFAAKQTGRKILGTIEYANAKWYEKPLVAFESMSLKGKVGVGAVALASSLGAAFAINHMRSDKDPETPAK